MESIITNSFDKDFIDYTNLIIELEEISNKENIYRTNQLQNDPKFKKFKEWLLNNGAIFDKNFDYPTSFGVFNVVGIKSKKNIENNEALLFVSNRLIIDSFHLKSTEEFKNIFDIPELKDYAKLNTLIITIFLLKEYQKIKSEEYSFWQPYIDLIEIESLLLWDEELLKELDEPSIIAIIKENRNDLHNYYLNLTKLFIIDAKVVDINKFIVFYSFVQSRNFYVNDGQLLLVPLADALNHKHVNVKYEIFDSHNYVCKHTLYFDDSIKSKKLKRTDNSLFYSSHKNTNSELFNHEKANDSVKKELDIADGHLRLSIGDYFVISTNDQIFKQGEQIFNFYSELSNECLMKWYGFCYLNNIYDSVKISLHLPKNEDYEFDKYLKILFEENLSETFQNNEIFNTLNFEVNSRKINLKLLQYVRFFYFYENDCVDEFLSYEFDMNIEIEVLKRCVELLEISYVKKSKVFNLKEDLKRLRKIYFEANMENDSELNLKMRLSNILIFRISQKMNLMNQMEICKSILKIFFNGINFSTKNNEKEEEMKSDCLESTNRKIYDFTSDQIFKENKNKIKKYFKNFRLL